MSLVYLLIAILVIMAMILLTSKRRAMAKYAGYIALTAPVIASIYFLLQVPSVIKQHYLSVSIPWMTSLDINVDLRLDGLSLMFSLLFPLLESLYSSMQHNIYPLVKIIYQGFTYT